MDLAIRLKRLHYRAHHRGTKEADLVLGGFFDAHAQGWNESETAWFEALMDCDDADILAWAMSQSAPPPRFEGPMMAAIRRLGYVTLSA